MSNPYSNTLYACPISEPGTPPLPPLCFPESAVDNAVRDKATPYIPLIEEGSGFDLLQATYLHYFLDHAKCHVSFTARRYSYTLQGTRYYQKCGDSQTWTDDETEADPPEILSDYQTYMSGTGEDLSALTKSSYINGVGWVLGYDYVETPVDEDIDLSYSSSTGADIQSGGPIRIWIPKGTTTSNAYNYLHFEGSKDVEIDGLTEPLEVRLVAKRLPWVGSISNLSPDWSFAFEATHNTYREFWRDVYLNISGFHKVIIDDYIGSDGSLKNVYTWNPSYVYDHLGDVVEPDDSRLSDDNLDGISITGRQSASDSDYNLDMPITWPASMPDDSWDGLVQTELTGRLTASNYLTKSIDPLGVASVFGFDDLPTGYSTMPTITLDLYPAT